eukprot:TRINITY_DN3700_c0_g1_i5.p1 TRINITY_DN3700_c0_g1~~TRINITY_DN3700_c0_g1_i5.p1  ORF type:complete len:127 (-),score=23.18 TRINITY_DN3700_c0_g1_i5:226-561(-)
MSASLPDEGVEEKLKKISTKFSTLDYKMDSIMNAGVRGEGGDGSDGVHEHSMTAILKSFQDLKRDHAQLTADVENFKADHNMWMEQVLNTFHKVSELQQECQSEVKQDNNS